MKILRTEILPALNNFVSVVQRDEQFFRSPFHYHPELELVYIIEGTGHRVIGDNIDPFNQGDMVLLGSNLPHVWMSDKNCCIENKTTRARSVVLYFDPQLFSSALLKTDESGALPGLFKNACRGLSIRGKTKDIIAVKLNSLIHKKNLERVICLFEILQLLSNSAEINFISTGGYTISEEVSSSDRLYDIFKYTHENFNRDITLSDIASFSCFTRPSFCRFFKQRTGKHFVAYLNEVRISKACYFLLNTDWPVSQIAIETGYKTASNFNKVFKKMKGVNPKIFREKAKR